MPAARKLFLHNEAYLVTFRTEEGLPFVSTNSMNEILWGIIGAAQNLFPVKITSLYVAGNHVHMIIVVEDPENVPRFVQYIKQESAHAINRLLGRKQRTVWSSRYDSPIILDFYSLLWYTAYTYLNPVKDKLCSHPSKYRGLSSWEMFCKGAKSRRVIRVRRHKIKQAENPDRLELDDWKIMKDLCAGGYAELFLKIDHFAWKHCFPESSDLTEVELRELVMKYVLTQLETIKNTGDYEPIEGQSMLRKWEPKAYGRKTQCLGSTKQIRVQYLKYYKYKVGQAEEAYARWKIGDFVPFPLGMFAPGFPRQGNIIPWSEA